MSKNLSDLSGRHGLDFNLFEELGIVAYGTQVPLAQTVEAQPRPVPSAPDPLESAEP